MSALPLELLLFFGRLASPATSEYDRCPAVLARVIRWLSRGDSSALAMLGIAPNLLARLNAIFIRRKMLTWCRNAALPPLGLG
jgi:hypothetical protein